MVARVIRRVVLVVLTGLILTGCGRQVSQESSETPGLLATGPDFGSLPNPPPFVVASMDAAGGLPAWTQCRRIDFSAIVTAHHLDSGLYLTEHRFTLYPWSDAIQVTAGEPQTQLVFEVVQGRYSLPGVSEMDVSPLSGSYQEYAEAVLQIVTTPARMLDTNATFARRPISLQIGGQWYQPIDVQFQPREIVSGEKGHKKTTIVEPYWTGGTYFQNHSTSLVDLIWLANPIAQRFLLVRGYDYARNTGEVLIPTKIEIFRSDRDAQPGPRLALIDLMR